MRDKLTPKQCEVLAFLAEGYTAKETGQLIGLTPGTVRGMACDIIARLGARNTAHAAAMWARWEATQ